MSVERWYLPALKLHSIRIVLCGFSCFPLFLMHDHLVFSQNSVLVSSQPQFNYSLPHTKFDISLLYLLIVGLNFVSNDSYLHKNEY